MDDVFPIPIYAAMLAATLAGQFAGIALDALLLPGHPAWVPLACSLLFEGIVGARYGAVRLGHPLTAGDRGRISVTYTLGLVVVSLPLAGWLSVSGHLPLPRVSTSAPALAVGVALAVALAVL